MLMDFSPLWQTTIDAALIEKIFLLLLGAGISFAVSAYWKGKTVSEAVAAGIAKGHADLVTRVDVLDKQLALMGQTVAPISTAFQSVLVKELTHFHTPVLDALLVKIGPPSTLTPDEEVEMAKLLKQRTVDMGDQITEQEREAAEILPLIIKRAKAEQAALDAGAPVQVKFVSIKPNEEK
jgi:hypothetical protein